MFDESEQTSVQTAAQGKEESDDVSSLLLALLLSTKCNIGTAIKTDQKNQRTHGSERRPSFLAVFFWHKSFLMQLLILKAIVQAKV